MSTPITEILAPWMAKQRWFRGDQEPTLTPLGDAVLHDPDSSFRVELHIVRNGDDAATYFVPITRRATRLENESALIHVVDSASGGPEWIYDAPGDPAFGPLLLTAMAGRAETSDSINGHLSPAAPAELPLGHSRVLDAEQSNTSMVISALPTQHTPPVIVKVFRVLQDGHNPDVLVQRALATAGADSVPISVGDLHGRWMDNGEELSTHLAVAQEFLSGASDAWLVAVDAATRGTDFSANARALGKTTGEVHQLLARELGHAPTSLADQEAFADRAQARLTEAAGHVADIDAQRRAATEVFTAAAQHQWPPLQRIHGDFHLGQVLLVPVRGWVLLDFEGEPLQTLHQRNSPDVPLRDVAGMLRSFDYAAGMATRQSGADTTAWLAASRNAFLDGYQQATGVTPKGEMLRAFELDKALYEVSYEARYRPSWLDIPVAGVRRLLEDHNRAGTVKTTASPPASGTATPHAPSTTDLPEVPDTKESTVPDQPDPDFVTGGQPVPTGDADPTTHLAPAESRSGAADPADRTLDAGPASTLSDAPQSGTFDEPASTPAAREVPSNPAGGAQVAPAPCDPAALRAVIDATHHSPHDLLGAHLLDGVVTIRTIRHLADDVVVVTPAGKYPATHIEGGVWAAAFRADAVPDYRLDVTYDGYTTRVDDSYRFIPTLGELDRHLISEGRHEELWTVLGAHVRRYDSIMGDIEGASFAVWAPNAKAVRVIGEFNNWDGRSHAMRSLGNSGVWEIFIPGAGVGQGYKYEIRYPDGSWHEKADPMARRTEVPPATASVIDESSYDWQDGTWMQKRTETDPHAGPLSVYEVHLGSWRPGKTYRQLADELVAHVTYLGFTHVELMPVAEHPFGGSWGYQVTGYYAPTSRLGNPDDLRYLIDSLHQAGIGVLLDWVPAHFPKDEWALARFDGTPLYEDSDPTRAEQPDWGTYVFNYGRNEVRNFLVANALYWLQEFHIDGLRVDAVASMLYLDYSREPGQWRPNYLGGREHLEAISFLQETNATAYRKVPGIMMIAEESTAWPGITAMTSSGGIGFGLKWNMGWMNDTLSYLSEEPINRRYHHGELTFSMVYAFSEKFVLPLSHDEVVHGKGSILTKMPGDRWQQLAGVRALYGYQWSHPGKQLLFMGQEFAQESEWNEGKGLEWGQAQMPQHDAITQLVHQLNHIYLERPALWQQDFTHEGFEWINANDGNRNVLSYVRHASDGSDPVVCIINFAGTPHENYRLGLPLGGEWEEILNTDDDVYAGSGVTNPGPLQSDRIFWDGRASSIELRVPPMAAVWLAPRR